MQIERLHPTRVPWYQKKMLLEHLERYNFASNYIKNKTVLELGCGNGYGTHLLMKKGAKKIIGIDLDPKAITFANNNYSNKNIQYRSGDAETIRLPDSSIDIVVSFETIEHVPNPKKMVQTVQKVLKQDGIFIVSTPNIQTSFMDNPFHLKEFTPKELRDLLQNFSSIQWYGQRKVHTLLITLYKKLYPILPKKLRSFLKFRPWEHYTIQKIQDDSNTVPYLYLIAVCKK